MNLPTNPECPSDSELERGALATVARHLAKPGKPVRIEPKPVCRFESGWAAVIEVDGIKYPVKVA